jgi:hypothetical protein
MKEFFRRNKLLFQFLLGIAILLGLDEGQTLGLIASEFSTALLLSNSVLRLEWWTTPIWAIPFGRILLAVLFVGMFINAVFTIRYRDRPLSILSTNLELRFLNGGAHVTTTRFQHIRANRPGVCASFFSVALSSPAAAFGEITGGIDHPSNLGLDIKRLGHGSKRDIYFCYKPELPYGWVLSLIPRWMLNWGPKKLPAFIDKYLVVHWLRYVSEHEYDTTQQFQLTSNRYQHLRVVIKLDFSADTGPRPEDASQIRVARRFSNAVMDEEARMTCDPHIYLIDLGRGLNKDETITVTWERH